MVGTCKLNWGAISTLLFGAAAASFCALMLIGNERAHDAGRAQLLDKSIGVYRMVTLDARDTDVTVTETVTYAADDRPIPHLIAQIGTNAAGQGVVVDWDYETKRLKRLCVPLDFRAYAYGNPLPAHTALTESAAWLRRLHIATDATLWRQVGGVHHESRNYMVRWRGPDSIAIFILNDSTLQLICVNVNPR